MFVLCAYIRWFGVLVGCWFAILWVMFSCCCLLLVSRLILVRCWVDVYFLGFCCGVCLSGGFRLCLVCFGCFVGFML